MTATELTAGTPRRDLVRQTAALYGWHVAIDLAEVTVLRRGTRSVRVRWSVLGSVVSANTELRRFDGRDRLGQVLTELARAVEPEVARGSGPLRMWHVYCDHHACGGLRVSSWNREHQARTAARQHAAQHEPVTRVEHEEDGS